MYFLWLSKKGNQEKKKITQIEERNSREVSFTRIDLSVSLLCLNDGVFSSHECSRRGADTALEILTMPRGRHRRQDEEAVVNGGVDIYRKPRMVASNENSAASNEFVSSVRGKSTMGLRIEKDRDKEGERDADKDRTWKRRRMKLRMKQDVGRRAQTRDS